MADRSSPPPITSTGHAIVTEDLGVEYSLRFSRKNTIQRTLGQFLSTGAGRAILGPASRLVQRRPRRVAGRHRSEWRRQEHAAPGPGRHHPPVGGCSRRPGPHIRTADPRRRLRRRAHRTREHPAGRRLPRPRRPGHPRDSAGGRRIRRSGAVHRRAAEDLLLRHARASGLRDSHLRRSGRPAPRRGAVTGDATFREKSKARVIGLVEDAKAVVLVTHDMNWVREYCNRAILLESGRLALEGSPDEVVAMHEQHTKETKERRAREAAEAGLSPAIASTR